MGTGASNSASRVLAAGAGITVLCGPAASGKTAAALDLYEQYQADPAAPGCLLLAPNRLTVSHLRELLLARSGSGVLVAPRVMTFGRLAAHVLSAGGVEHTPISPIRRRALLAGIVAELAADKALTALAGVADTPGLISALDRTIAELKRAAVEPEQLRAVLGRRPGMHADLLAVYAAYQQHLAARHLYDEEGQLWQARLALEGDGAVPWPGLRAVVADGFTDFTPTQLAILRLLSRQAERTVITLPFVQESGHRGGLWHWTARQLDRIGQAFEGACQTVHLPSGQAGPADRLLVGLFGLAVPAEPPGWPEGVSLVAAGSLDGECRAIARWVKGHLAAGAGPHELAVIARDAEPYQAALARVFVEAGIPAPAAPQPLAETALGRLLANLAALADGFGSPEALALLGSSYFRPSALGPFDDADAAVAQLVIRQGNVVDGRDSYAAAAERLGRRVEGDAADEEDELASPLRRHLARIRREGVERAGRLLAAVLALADDLAAGGTLGELAGRCRAILDALHLRSAVTDGDTRTVAADLRALAAIEALLDELGSLGDLPAAARRLTPGEFAEQLRLCLAAAECPPERPTGAVLLASALDGRALRARHVWLAGLNEGQFPASPSEQALLGEAERRTWAARLSLDARDDLAAREMLLFYLTLARADQTLTLSWLYSDSGGRTMQRSGYVDALARLAGPIDGRLTKLPPAEFAPRAERIVSARELLNSALAAAGREPAGAGQAALLPAWQTARRRHPQSLARLAGPLWAHHRRWRRGPSDAYDGVLDDPALLEALAATVPAKLTFSATQINGYLSCPWRYFAEYWLKLEPLVDPQEELLPRQRGLLVHAVLRRLFSALLARGAAPLASLTAPDALAALDDALAAEAALAERFEPAYPALWRVELAAVRRTVEHYLARQAADAPAAEAVCTELGFGMGDDPHADPASMAEPVALDGPAGTVRLRGKIDRVDRAGPAGGLFVVDYKTGALPDLRADVQLAVYLRAAERVLGVPALGAAFHAVREGQAKDAAISALTDPPRNIPPFEQWLGEALDRLHAAVGAIAAGDFDAVAAHDCAAGRCPYRRICGHSQSRALVKRPPEPT